jgi:uncharacterized protein (TIGR02246 family)
MKLLTCVLSIALIAGCTAPEENVQLTPDFNEFVKAAALTWNDAWAEGDAEAIGNQYARDAILLPPGSAPITGRDSIQAYYAIGMAADPGGGITTLEAFSDGEYGYERGTYTSANAEGEQTDAGKYLAVWKLVDGEWKIYRDTFNSSMMPETGEMGDEAGM